MLEKIRKDNKTLKMWLIIKAFILGIVAFLAIYAFIDNMVMRKELKTMKERHIGLLEKMGIYDKSEYLLIIKRK